MRLSAAHFASCITVAALWNLVLKILSEIVLPQTFDPTVFQAGFGMIFTVIIALGFKRSLLVLAERQTFTGRFATTTNKTRNSRRS